jgi:hypothetical protein
MTREEVVEIVFSTKSRVLDRLRLSRPQWECDALQLEAAQDSVDLLMALGLIVVDPPSPQETAND